MRQHPFHNVKDVKKLTEKAFSEVSEEFVWNCYRHVEDQEEYYRKMLKIDPLPMENIESWEINHPEETFENSYNLPEIHFMSNIQDIDDSQTNDENIDEGEMDVKVPTFRCSKCNFESQSIKLWRNHLQTHFECEECGKTFFGNQGRRNYNRHVEKHKPKPPKSHKYDQCNKTFQHKSYLKRHIEKKHQQQITNCSSPPALITQNDEPEIVANEIQTSSRRKQKIVARKLF